MLAAGTQGKWTADTLGNWIMAGIMRVCDMRGWGYLTGIGGLHLSDEQACERQAANCILIAACVNGKERELLAIEGLLTLYTRDRCMLTYPAKQEVEAILTRWLEGREADEKA